MKNICSLTLFCILHTSVFVCVVYSQGVIRDDFFGEELFYTFINPPHVLIGLILTLSGLLLHTYIQTNTNKRSFTQLKSTKCFFRT